MIRFTGPEDAHFPRLYVPPPEPTFRLVPEKHPLLMMQGGEVLVNQEGGVVSGKPVLRGASWKTEITLEHVLDELSDRLFNLPKPGWMSMQEPIRLQWKGNTLHISVLTQQKSFPSYLKLFNPEPDEADAVTIYRSSEVDPPIPPGVALLLQELDHRLKRIVKTESTAITQDLRIVYRWPNIAITVAGEHHNKNAG